MGKYGFSFSWKRAIVITVTKKICTVNSIVILVSSKYNPSYISEESSLKLMNYKILIFIFFSQHFGDDLKYLS
jgi:hypothetical protein